MDTDRLMSLLDDRPQCCAGLRAAATERIKELEKTVERQQLQISLLTVLIREFGIGEEKAHTITAAAYDGDIESRCRNWRGLHIAHSGLLFEAAAEEIRRLKGEARR